MALDPNNITATTFIDTGFPLTNSFILEHFTSGARSVVSGDFIPLLPTNIFQQRYGNTPLWGIVRNLAASGISVIEPLLAEFGGSLIIRQAYSISNAANEVRHMFGGGFDIMIGGMENDLAYVAKDIQKIASMADSLTLNFGASSWMHLDINPTKLASNWSSTSVSLPSIQSVDLINGITQQGIAAMRGMSAVANDISGQTFDLSTIGFDVTNLLSSL